MTFNTSTPDREPICPLCLNHRDLRGECPCVRPPPLIIDPPPVRIPAPDQPAGVITTADLAATPPPVPIAPPNHVGPEAWGLYDGAPNTPLDQRLNYKYCGADPVKAQMRAFSRCNSRRPHVVVTCNGQPRSHYAYDPAQTYPVVVRRAPRTPAPLTSPTGTPDTATPIPAPPNAPPPDTPDDAHTNNTEPAALNSPSQDLPPPPAPKKNT